MLLYDRTDTFSRKVIIKKVKRSVGSFDENDSQKGMSIKSSSDSMGSIEDGDKGLTTSNPAASDSLDK